LRLKGKKASDENKSKLWKATWDDFCGVMANVDIKLPKDAVKPEDNKKILDISEQLWDLPVEDQRVAIAVLTQLCDCIVWWTQRYKTGRMADESDS